MENLLKKLSDTIPEKLGWVLFWIVSLTWGCIMTFLGLLVALILIIAGKKPHLMGPFIYFYILDNWGGVSFGPVFVCGKSDGTRHLMCHETGHAIQTVLFGPIAPLICDIPSAIRYWYREIIYRTNPKKYWTFKPYDSIWFEDTATRWGAAANGKYWDRDVQGKKVEE